MWHFTLFFYLLLTKKIKCNSWSLTNKSNLLGRTNKIFCPMAPKKHGTDLKTTDVPEATKCLSVTSLIDREILSSASSSCLFVLPSSALFVEWPLINASTLLMIAFKQICLRNSIGMILKKTVARSHGELGALFKDNFLASVFAGKKRREQTATLSANENLFHLRFAPRRCEDS